MTFSKMVYSWRTFLFLALLVLALAALEPASGNWLRFDREAIAAGEVWRLLTAHWVHLSWPHALGNLGGLLLLAYICGEQLNRAYMLQYLLFSMLFVGGGLYWLAPDLLYYVGLSGVLHGLILVGIFRSPFYSRRIAWLFLLIIAGKVIWEQTPWYDDNALQGVIGGRVETRAHLLGTLSAVLWLIASQVWQYLWRRRYDG